MKLLVISCPTFCKSQLTLIIWNDYTPTGVEVVLVTTINIAELAGAYKVIMLFKFHMISKILLFV